MMSARLFGGVACLALPTRECGRRRWGRGKRGGPRKRNGANRRQPADSVPQVYNFQIAHEERRWYIQKRFSA